MASDPLNADKVIGPNYQYTGPIEGKSELPIGPIVPDSGSPMIMKDEISSAGLEPGQVKFTAPPVDNPNAPVPTKKAIRLMATRKAIQEEAIKGKDKTQTESSVTRNGGNNLLGAERMGNSGGPSGTGSPNALGGKGLTAAGGAGGPPSGGEVNPWLKFPNLTSKLNMALLDIATTQSKTRFTEAQILMVIGTALFKAGMENADLAKLLKDLAANKELMKAIGSFIQAGFALYQMGALAQARGKTREEVYDKKSQSSLDIAQQEKAVQKKLPQQLATESDKDFQKNLQQAKNTAEYKKEAKELDRLKNAQHAEFEQRSQIATQLVDAKFRMYNSFTEGIMGVISSVMTKKEGDLEKQKAINDTFMQLASRLSDAAAKAKDDAGSQIDKILQQMAQQSSDMRVHASSRG